MKPDARRRHRSDTMWLWLITQTIDYLFALALCYSQTIHGLPLVPFDGWKYAGILIAQGHLSVLLLYLREEIYFWLLGSLVAKEKIQGSLSRQTWYHVVQTAVFSQTSFFFLGILDLFNTAEPSWTWEFWGRAYLEFYAMLLLRDVFSLGPFHGLMHRPQWYFLHKKHHQIGRNAQSLHAFHIDLLDLILENTGAPSLLLAGQYLLGVKPGVHWFAAALLTSHDGSLHSINPYSAMYFNPLLDHLLKGNICHQLHHALNKDYLLFVPYRHLWSSRERQSDIEKYNAVFKTNFVLR